MRSERVLLVVGFLSALGALLFFAWIAEEMLEGDTARFDSMVTAAVHAHASAPATVLMKALTVLGSSAVMTPLAILTLILCYTRREFHALKTLAVTFGGALILEFLLKWAFHRPRPVPFFDLPAPASFSCATRNASSCAFVISVSMCASFACTNWKLAIGLPNWIRCSAYCRASSS